MEKYIQYPIMKMGGVGDCCIKSGVGHDRQANVRNLGALLFFSFDFSACRLCHSNCMGVGGKDIPQESSEKIHQSILHITVLSISYILTASALPLPTKIYCLRISTLKLLLQKTTELNNDTQTVLEHRFKPKYTSLRALPESFQAASGT